MEFLKLFKKKFKKLKKREKALINSIKINDEICDKLFDEVNELKEKNKIMETCIREIENNQAMLTHKMEHDDDIDFLTRQISELKKCIEDNKLNLR